MTAEPALAVRTAQLGDVKPACRLYNRYVKESTATFHCHTQTEEEFEEKFLLPLPYGAWVAKEKGRSMVLGYSVLTPFIDRCAATRWSAEVTIYLNAGTCGRGIGRLLLAAADDHARAHRIRTVVAVICSENTGSCRFFGRKRVSALWNH